MKSTSQKPDITRVNEINPADRKRLTRLWGPLGLATACGDEVEVRRLLSSGIDPNFRSLSGMRPIDLAGRSAWTGTRIYRLLLKAGANPDGKARNKHVKRSFTPLHAAVMHDDLQAVRLLLDYGADLRIREPNWNLTPLGLAEFHCMGRMENLLKKYRPERCKR